MKRFAHMALVTLMMVAIAGPAMAEDKEKKKGAKGQKGQRGAALRVPPSIELTAEQKAKVAEISKKHAPAAKEAREKMAAVMTKEMMAKRREAMKAAKEAGKKGKEAQEMINAAMNLSAEQKEKVAAAQKALREVQMAFLGDIKEILTDEQKAKLPKRGGKKAGDAKPKKKKKKDE